MPTTPSGLAPKLDLMERHENARDAIQNARKLLPGWQATARMLSRKKDVKVKLVANDFSKTDGKTILIKVPYELANLPEHDRSICGRRGEHDLLVCTACDVLEDVNITVIHEVCHIVFDTFDDMTEYERSRIIQTAIDLHAEGTPSEARLRQIKKKLQQLQEAGIKDYFTISNTVSPYFPLLINALEDIRVNTRMQEHRPGTKVMFNAQTAKIFREGIKDFNGKAITWESAPINAQAVISLYCKAGGFDYEHALSSEVIEKLDDEILDDLCAKTTAAKSVHQVYRLAVPLLERLRQLGFCLDPEDPEDPPQESDEEQDEPDNGDAQGDRQAEGGSDSDQEEQDSDDPSAGDMDPGDSGDDSSEKDAGEGSSESKDPGNGNEASDSQGEEGESGSSEENSENSEDGGDGTDDSSGSEGSGGPSGEGGSEDESSSDSDSSDSSSLEDGTVDENDQERDGDNSNSGDSSGETTGESEGSESNVQEPEGDNNKSDMGSGESSERDDEDLESDQSGDDSNSLADDSSEKSEADQSDPTDSDKEGTGERTDDSVEPETQDSSGESEEPSDQLAPAEGDPDTGDQSVTTPQDSPPTGSNTDSGSADTGQSENGPETSDKDSQEPYSQADQERDGKPSDIEHLFAIFGRHEKQEVSPSEAIEEQINEEVLETALQQIDFFDSPSLNIDGVKEYQFIEGEGAWGRSRYYNRTPIPVTEGMLVSALQRLRLVFTDNARGRTERNRRTGKVDGRVLAKRAPQGDDRLFKKRTVPGRKDYFVLIGMDCSGSTAKRIDHTHIMLDMIKAAAGAKAELLSRLGIPFAMYAHSGDWENVAIFEIKKPNDRWGVVQKEALELLNPYSGNIDGHTLEYYRKVVERRTETDKLIFYFTDGAMPASNYNEELEILQREIKTCERLNIKLIGIGVQSDAPLEHGLDTVLLDEISDLPHVINEVRKRLT